MDDAPLVKGRGVHAPLNGFNQANILDLQDLIQVLNGLYLRLIRVRGLQVEIIGLQRPLWTHGNDVEHDHRGATRIAHQAGRGIEPPDRMGRHLRIGSVIGGVGEFACFCHVTGIDAMGRDLIGIHIDQGAKILVRCWTVIAL